MQIKCQSGNIQLVVWSENTEGSGTKGRKNLISHLDHPWGTWTAHDSAIRHRAFSEHGTRSAYLCHYNNSCGVHFWESEQWVNSAVKLLGLHH